jgi:putative inorganic carbon (HCO3(-)) transporter
MMFERLRQVSANLLPGEIWVAGIAVAASMVSFPLLPWAIVIMLVFWLARWIACGKLSQRTPTDMGIGIIVLMGIISIWTTAVPEVTLTQVYRLISGVVLFYAIVNWAKSPVRLWWIYTGVVVTGAVLALGAAFSVEWAAYKIPVIPASFYEKFTLLVSDTVNPNVLAGSLVILFPVIVALIVFGWREMRWAFRLPILVVAVGVAIVIILTQSRSAMIAFIFTLLLLPILRWRWAWIVVIILVVAGWVGIWFLRDQRIFDLPFVLWDFQEFGSRVEIWSRAIYMIQDFPITGIGMGTFLDVADQFYPFLMHSQGTVNHAHNLFLQVAVDLGVVGLIAWLSVLMAVFIVSWRVYVNGLQTDRIWLMGLGAGLLCSQIALVVHGLTDAVTWGMVRPAPVVWALWGVVMATWNVWIGSNIRAHIEA